MKAGNTPSGPGSPWFYLQYVYGDDNWHGIWDLEVKDIYTLNWSAEPVIKEEYLPRPNKYFPFGGGKSPSVIFPDEPAWMGPKLKANQGWQRIIRGEEVPFWRYIQTVYEEDNWRGTWILEVLDFEKIDWSLEPVPRKRFRRGPTRYFPFGIGGDPLPGGGK